MRHSHGDSTDEKVNVSTTTRTKQKGGLAHYWFREIDDSTNTKLTQTTASSEHSSSSTTSSEEAHWDDENAAFVDGKPSSSFLSIMEPPLNEVSYLAVKRHNKVSPGLLDIPSD